VLWVLFYQLLFREEIQLGVHFLLFFLFSFILLKEINDGRIGVW